MSHPVTACAGHALLAPTETAHNLSARERDRPVDQILHWCGTRTISVWEHPAAGHRRWQQTAMETATCLRFIWSDAFTLPRISEFSTCWRGELTCFSRYGCGDGRASLSAHVESVWGSDQSDVNTVHIKVLTGHQFSITATGGPRLQLQDIMWLK